MKTKQRIFGFNRNLLTQLFSNSQIAHSHTYFHMRLHKNSRTCTCDCAMRVWILTHQVRNSTTELMIMFKQYSWQFESYEVGRTLTSVFIKESKLCSKSLFLYLLIVLLGDSFSNCNFSEEKKTWKKFILCLIENKNGQKYSIYDIKVLITFDNEQKKSEKKFFHTQTRKT